MIVLSKDFGYFKDWNLQKINDNVINIFISKELRDFIRRGKGLEAWAPRTTKYRYEEDIIFEGKKIQTTITEKGDKEIPKYIETFYNIGLEAMKIVEANIKVKEEQEKIGVPISLDYGLRVLSYVVYNWIGTNIPLMLENINDQLIVKKENTPMILDFFYYLKYFTIFFKVNITHPKSGIDIDKYSNVKKIYKNLVKMFERYNKNKQDYFTDTKISKQYFNYEALIDTGSAKNFISLTLARQLKADFLRDVFETGGFTTAQTGAISIHPKVKTKVIIIHKDLKTNESKQYEGEQEFGIIPLMTISLIDYHILIGKAFLDSLKAHKIQTIL